MVSKTHTLAILLLTYITSVFATCKKENCSENNYSFLLGVQARPDTDSIRVGDTLWVRIDESNQLRDQSTGQVIDFSEAANLSFVFGLGKVISAIQVDDAAAFFDYYIRKGKYVGSFNTSRFRNFGLDELNGRYYLEIGFIPKQTGIYRILIERAANVYTRRRLCDRSTFSPEFQNTNQHFYLGYNISGEGVYYFKAY